MNIKSGYLMKEGGKIKTWKKRYFELDDSLLCYYKDENKKALLGAINLSIATNILAIDNYHKKFNNIIRIITPSRNFHINPSTHEERLEWLRSLTFQSEESNICKPRASAVPVKQKDFIHICFLGKGAYGKVFLVKMKNTDDYFAMKTIEKKQVIEYEEIEHTMSERRILSKLHHPFLVNLHYSFQTPSHLFYIIDYCPGGELYYYLQKKRSVTEEDAKFYAAQILLAIEHLHSSRIVYRDIKPENILIDSDGYLRLTDFGLSKENVGKDNTTGTFCGTPEYLAPEVVIGKNYAESVDWWGFGILIYEMIHGNAPFTSEDIQDLFQLIVHTPLKFPTESYPSLECKECITQLLVKDPSKRLTDPDLIKSLPWFKGFDWEALYKKKMTPPYIPVLKDKADTSNFNKDIINEQVELDETSAPDSQNYFNDFTYCK
ncbi:Protein kinase C [Entamoeba marina]